MIFDGATPIIASSKAKLRLKPIVCLMGPTCSGKTALALALRSRYFFDIISVDSALVYRDLNIGTAKPDQDTLARYPHALIDIISPDQSYSAKKFVEDSTKCIQSAWQNNKVPLLVGGTMLYFNVLQQGLSELPRISSEIKAHYQTLQLKQGTPYLHAQLKKRDPCLYVRLHPQDTQRVLRALTVFESTQIPLSGWQRSTKYRPFSKKQFLNILLIPVDRAALHRAIQMRFETMLASGFLEEVAQLKKNYKMLSPELPSMRSVGYRQAWAYLDNKHDYAYFKDKTIIATRQLAKRQLTWLRTWPQGFCYNAQSDNQHTLIDFILNSLRNYENKCSF